ncbi:MAG: PDR/VanB family oxidoreductase [Micrococcales bacterium]|nr:PDR/VanB family oxidoreductase [Micrococcales bacterium]
MSMATETVVREHEADLVVEAVTRESEGVVSLRLAAPEGVELPEWTPGAHVDLLLGDDLVRQYSLCGQTADRAAYRVAVLLEPESRGGSKFVHEQLSEGATVRVRGPRNHFALASAPRYIFIAGGIGITPVLPMIAEAEAAGADWHLYYGGRTKASMAFLPELEPFGDKVTLVPQDEAGHLPLDDILGEPRPGTLVYCCGPGALLDAVENACETWPSNALHLERFTAKPIDDRDNTEFEVVLERSGLTLQVPADQSIFDVVRANGVSVLGSCLEGVCGTCETDVLEGEVDHRDSVLDDDEKESNEMMMICVSRCKGAQLTLDL